MKLTTILLLTASIICSSWAYPANSHPDDDVEVINGGSQPGYQPTPSVPSFPGFPFIPTIPSIPSIPSVPVYPSFSVPGYPTYPSYFPFGWTYNIFDGFSNFFNTVRTQASTAWDHVPSIRPMINNYWPGTNTNGTTTSTVKVVGEHKFIINETVHVQQSDFGHVVFKVRTVDIKPLNGEDSTESVDEETTTRPEGDIDVANTPRVAENENDDDDDRESVFYNGDIDGDQSGSEVLNNANEIPGSLEDFEKEDTTESSAESNDIEKQSASLKKVEKIAIEALSAGNSDHSSNEWSEFELENVDDHKNTNNEVNNNENDSGEEVIHDLTNDIAINQMLADQGASHNPDAEVFDIHQYELERDASKAASMEINEPQQESFDYLPYPHQTNKQPSGGK